MMAPAPPAWADTWLRLLLPVRDRDTVSGDLMEEYRENIRPNTSRLAADIWYVGQVSRFAWRIALWGLVLAAIYSSRMAYDWFVPTSIFEPRAAVTTWTMIGTLLVIGASSSLRTRSVMAGIVSTTGALVVSAIISAAVLAFVYWNWRSSAMLEAIANSGGFNEAFTTPVILIVPGTVIGAIGAFVASIGHRQKRSTD